MSMSYGSALKKLQTDDIRRSTPSSRTLSCPLPPPFCQFDSSDEDNFAIAAACPPPELVLSWLPPLGDSAAPVCICGLPGGKFPAERRSLQADLAVLVAAGVTDVVCFCSAADLRRFRVPSLLAAYTNANLRVFHLPLEPDQSPSPEALRVIASLVRNDPLSQVLELARAAHISTVASYALPTSVLAASSSSSSSSSSAAASSAASAFAAAVGAETASNNQYNNNNSGAATTSELQASFSPTSIPSFLLTSASSPSACSVSLSPELTDSVLAATTTASPSAPPPPQTLASRSSSSACSSPLMAVGSSATHSPLTHSPRSVGTSTATATAIAVGAAASAAPHTYECGAFDHERSCGGGGGGGGGGFVSPARSSSNGSASDQLCFDQPLQSSLPRSVALQCLLGYGWSAATAAALLVLALPSLSADESISVVRSLRGLRAVETLRQWGWLHSVASSPGAIAAAASGGNGASDTDAHNSSVVTMDE